MSTRLQFFTNYAAHFALGLLWLTSLLSMHAAAAPAWRTPGIVAHANKNLGCVNGCNFGHIPHSNATTSTATEYLLTTGNGEPIKFPELSAGHFLVIPVAAVLAIGYHMLKVKAERPPS